jgi:PAS domain S-box-containing protein
MRDNQDTKNDIIQDITLLYELSLAIGKSLDLRTNILNFIRVLQSRKNLNYVSFWIKDRYLNFDRSLPNSTLIASIPSYLDGEKTISNKHKIYQLLIKSNYIKLDSDDFDFKEINTEKNIKEGCYTLFKLGNIGFLKLYRSKNINTDNDKKLEQIIKKLTTSIEGSLFHAKSVHESKIRQQTEIQLREKNYLYKKLVEGLDEGMVIVDKHFKISYANPQFLVKTGYSFDEIVGKNPIDIFHYKDDRERIIKQREKLVNGKKNIFESKFIIKDGSFLEVHISSTPLFDDNQNYYGSVNLFLDITERKKMEENLKESEERTKLIIQSALDAIIIIDIKGIVTHWNEQAKEIFGWTESEAIGESLSKLIIPENYRAAHEKGIKHYLKTEHGPVLNRRREITGQHKSGRIFPVELAVQSLKHNNKIFFSAFVRDITEPKNAKIDLETTHKRLETLIVNLQSGILLEDENRNIIITNQEFCDIFKISAPPETLIGMDCSESAKQSAHLLSEPEQFIESIAGVLNDRETRIDERIEFADGRVFERDYIPIFSNDNYFGHLWQYKNITDKIKYQDELKIAKQTAEEANISKSRFLANTSHEIRTPLNAIYGFSKLLDETEKSKDQEKYISGIKTSSSNLLNVVNNVLDFSKIESGETKLDITACHLPEIINQLFQTFEFRAEEKEIQLSFNIDSNIQPYIYADIAKLNQVFLNLLSNAIKFTQQGLVKFDCLLEKNTKNKVIIQFIVSDTGIGINKKSQTNIFKIFKQEDESITRKYGGTGLGLAISKQLVELMGGKIQVESTKGVGSRFFFNLEFKKAKQEDVKQKISKIEIDEELLKGKRILLVEDNEFNQIIAISMLEKWQVDIDTAENGKIALQKLKTQSYDLILMDKQMPIMDGIQACKIIRQEMNLKIPIIALTANVLKGVISTCKEAGMNDYISKPFEPELLFHKIAKVLNLNYNGDLKLKENHTIPKIQVPDRLLDLSKLEKMMNNKDEMVKRMLRKFKDLTPNYIDDLDKAFINQNWDELSKIAHKIKPSINLVGIDSLNTDFQNLEAFALDEKDLRSIPEIMERINSYMPYMFLEIDEKLKL